MVMVSAFYFIESAKEKGHYLRQQPVFNSIRVYALLLDESTYVQITIFESHFQDVNSLLYIR